MKYLSLKAVLVLCLITSCTKVPTINLKEHSFNKSPDDIIIVQLTNLDQDVFAELKFNQTLINNKIFTENFNCIGQMWRLNHSKLKPSLSDSLFTQVTGFPRSENSCDKYNSEIFLPENFIKFGFGSIYYEKGNSNFVDEAKACSENIFKNTIVFRSIANSKSQTKTFHAEKRMSYDVNKIYEDESCSSKDCFINNKENFNHIWTMTKNYPRRVVLFRDFYTQDKIKAELSKKVKELDDFLNYLTGEFASKNPQALIVVTNTISDSVTTKVWALGPMSENFCGEYLESTFYNRFFWKSNKTEFFPFRLP